MSDILHSPSFRNASASQSSDRCNPEAMKASPQQFGPDAAITKQRVPSKSWIALPSVGRCPVLGSKALKQWNQFRMQRCTVVPASFDSKGYCAPAAIRSDFNIGERVQPRLGHATALIPGNGESVLEKLSFGWVRHFRNSRLDPSQVFISKFRLSSGASACNIQILARISRDITALDRLGHNHAQDGQFIFDVVNARGIFAFRAVRVGSPLHIIQAVIAGKMARDKNATLDKVALKCVPNNLVPLKRARGFGVLDKVRWNPSRPSLVSRSATVPSLIKAFLGAQFFGPARGVAIADFEAGRFAAIATTPIVRNPPEGRAFAFVKRCHCTKCAAWNKNAQTNRENTKLWTAFASVSRGIASVYPSNSKENQQEGVSLYQ